MSIREPLEHWLKAKVLHLACACNNPRHSVSYSVAVITEQKKVIPLCSEPCSKSLHHLRRKWFWHNFEQPHCRFASRWSTRSKPSCCIWQVPTTTHAIQSVTVITEQQTVMLLLVSAQHYFIMRQHDISPVRHYDLSTLSEPRSPMDDRNL